MRKLSLVTIAVTVIVAVSGCGGSHLVQSARNPQTKQDITHAQSIVEGCLQKGNFITARGRKAVVTCIAPPGHEAAFERCASKALAHPFLTHRERERIVQGLAVCAEEDR